MSIPTALWLAYAGYLVWVCAGLADFICHWRTDLPHTSGVAESATHLLQLALLGIAVVLGLAFAPGRTSVMLILVLVVAHAAVGYVDTRFAFKLHRVVLPVEQHLHSVLDMAPIAGFAWWVVASWPAAVRGGWGLDLLQPMLPLRVWLAVLLPALLLSVAPALVEFRAAWQARRSVRPAAS